MDELTNPALPKRELYAILGALMLGMFLAALDSTIVSTALPTIVAELHGANHLSWVVVSYLLASTVTTPMWGKLGDLHGRKIYFQAAIVIFLVGSVLCGLSTSMMELILFRALQGIGGGGLLVGAQSIIADIIPPRERGRYAGFFGATFGAATVLGPLAGGLIVEYFSWRWVFYVNIPFGILALIVTTAALPNTVRRMKHTIDYVGFLTLTCAASALILFTTLGGNSFAWASSPSILLAVGGVVLTVVFVFIERKAKEPIIAPHLFANRVFSSASTIGFVVGFAMYGAMTFLPLFLQEVRGVTPTMSGVRLLPMMVGLFGASILTGFLVSRGSKYRIFPILGTAVMTGGLLLLGTVGVTTSSWYMSFDMLVFGIGLGLVMQILVTAVQNAVEMQDIGAATAGANFFRSIGGSFGTAVFGAIYVHEFPLAWTADLHAAHLKYVAPLTTSLTPAQIKKIPPAYLSVISHSIATSVQTLFHYAVPVGALALLLSLTLPEIKLRTSVGHNAREDLVLGEDSLL